MARNGDWLPTREQNFADLCQIWKTGLSDPGNVSAFGWKQTEVDGALSAIEEFLRVRLAYEEIDSSKNRLKKDEAKDAAKRAMRTFANTSLRFNKLMGEEDKLPYGLGPRVEAHRPEGPPASFPEAEPDTSIIRQLTIHFWDSVTKKRRKPRGVHGAEIRWALLDHAPGSVEELSRSDFNTASPYTLHFDERDRGKRLYFCLRWDSNTGLKGPFGEIYSAVIP